MPQVVSSPRWIRSQTCSSKIAVIGAEVGYDSEAAFSRAFKKATGARPRRLAGGTPYGLDRALRRQCKSALIWAGRRSKQLAWKVTGWLLAGTRDDAP
jgi:AraC-like DNA-binding protein